MRPRVLALAIFLLTPAAVLAPATAAAETCRGMAATIVGSPGASLTGTPGSDVVVTNGATSVDTGTGDDVVCTSGTPVLDDRPGIRVEVGVGDDVVDTTGDLRTAEIATALGQGSDTYEGGRARDYVYAVDEDPDVVHTGGGSDSVGIGGQTRAPADVVDTGASGDVVSVQGHLGRDTFVAGGSGRDQLYTWPSGGRWVYDNRVGEVRHNDVPAWHWEDLERFFLGYTNGARLRFLGGPADELLYVSAPGFVGARLGGGNDQVIVTAHSFAFGRPAVRAGTGRDQLVLQPFSTLQTVPRAVLDLAKKSLSYEDPTGGRPSLLVTSFESADIHARSARLLGSADSDSLTAWACDVEMDGRRGDDFLSVLPEHACGPASRRALSGGPGDDRLYGSPYADLLVGGPGSDRADGVDGRDRCAAETVRRCEVTLP